MLHCLGFGQSCSRRVAFAKACGAEGFRCERPDEVRSAIQAALNSPGVAVVEAVVDAEEKPAKPNELKA